MPPLAICASPAVRMIAISRKPPTKPGTAAAIALAEKAPPLFAPAASGSACRTAISGTTAARKTFRVSLATAAAPTTALSEYCSA